MATNTFNIGVSDKNLSPTKQSFTKLFVTDAQKALTGTEYKKVLQLVKDGWTGGDADEFVKQFDSAVKKMTTDLEEICKYMHTEMDRANKAFADLRATNKKAIQ